MQRRLLFVDDEENIRITLAAILRKHAFEVTTAATVGEALQQIMTQKFDVLLSDLNIGNPGDGLTVVSAMRRTQPDAVTMILTGYPAFETALEAIRQQVDDYIVKPANIPTLVSAIESKLGTPPRQRLLPPLKRVAMILQEQMERVEEMWIAAVEQDSALSRIAAGREQQLAYVDAVLREVILAAQIYSGEETTRSKDAAVNRGPRRDSERYSPRMILTEFCLLRRVIAQVIQENLLAVNLSYLIPDLLRVNESLDGLAQAALEALPEPLSANPK